MRFGFNLKWFLIASLVVGCGGGMALRLLRHEPQMFQAIVGSACSLGALMILVGGAIKSGFRLRSRWEAPHCAACDKPLRETSPEGAVTCPSCGQSVTRLDQLRFERTPKRDRKLLAHLAVAALLPLLGGLTLAVCFPAGRTYAPMPTELLIDEQLPANLENPLVWDELRDRLAAGELDAEDAEAILAVVTEWARVSLPKGQPFYLPWASRLLEDPAFRAMTSEASLVELAEAGFKLSAKLLVVKEQDVRHLVEIAVVRPTPGPPIDLGVRPVWELKELSVDGEPVEYRPSSRTWVTQPGSHVVEVEGLKPGQVVEAEVEINYYRGKTDFTSLVAAPRESRDMLGEPLKSRTETAQTTVAP